MEIYFRDHIDIYKFFKMGKFISVNQRICIEYRYTLELISYTKMIPQNCDT